VRVRIAETTLVHDLLDFLRRCGCEVDQSSWNVLDVQLQPHVSAEAALSLVRISEVLAKLGSALCHDCRDTEAATGRAPERALSATWARMVIDSYLRVWRVWHPEAGVDVLDEPLLAGPEALARVAS
jgi:hypothetical protein